MSIVISPTIRDKLALKHNVTTAFEAGPAEIHRYLAAGGKTV
jgi:hypothetical protein